MNARQIDIVKKIASFYDIDVAITTDYEQWDRPRICIGPSEEVALIFGSDTEKDLAIFHRHCGVEYAIHEIVHLIVQPPGIQIESMPEDFVLLQFERELARSFAKDDLAAVVEYQGFTSVPLLAIERDLHPWENNYLEEFDYESTIAWKRGFRNAIDLGLLDDQKCPTLRRPTWTRNLIRRARYASWKAFESWR